MVDKFGRGRVFIAGGKTVMYPYSSPSLIDLHPSTDAAQYVDRTFPHRLRLTSLLSVHSPAGGQGLNTCVQDAVGISQWCALHG